MYSTSCDDLGLFNVRLAPSTDARTAQAEMGYEVEIVSGSAPAGMLGSGPQTLVSLEAARLTYVWIDGATDAQEPLDVRFVLRAVDRGGNRSTPSDTVHVSHPGFAPGEARR